MGSRFLRSLELKNVHVDEIVTYAVLSERIISLFQAFSNTVDKLHITNKLHHVQKG